MKKILSAVSMKNHTGPNLMNTVNAPTLFFVFWAEVLLKGLCRKSHWTMYNPLVQQNVRYFSISAPQNDHYVVWKKWIIEFT